MKDYIDLNRITYIPIQGMKKTENIEQTVLNILSTTPETPWRFRDIYAALGEHAPNINFVRSVILDNVNGEREKRLFIRVGHGLYRLADNRDRQEPRSVKRPNDRDFHPCDLRDPSKRREEVITMMAINADRFWSASSIHAAIGRNRCDRQSVQNTLTTGINYPVNNPIFHRTRRGKYKLNYDNPLVRACIEGESASQYDDRGSVVSDEQAILSVQDPVSHCKGDVTDSLTKSDNRVTVPRDLSNPRNRKEAVIAVMANEPHRQWHTSAVRNAIGRHSCGIRAVQNTLTNGAHWPVNNPIFRRTENGRYSLNYDNPLVRACIERNVSGERQKSPEMPTASCAECGGKIVHSEGNRENRSTSAHFSGAESLRRVGHLRVVIDALNGDGTDAPLDEPMRVFLDDRMLAILNSDNHDWMEWPVGAIQSVSAIEKKRSGVIVNAEGLQITLDTGHIVTFHTNAGDAEQWLSAISAVMANR